jgi:site-specific DNA-methyltransferase (adenine-specific)
MELMARYADNYFDLAIVDPPYGLNINKKQMGAGSKYKHGRKKRNGFPAKNWDSETPSKEYFKELFRVSKNQIIWGGNFFDLGTCYGYCIWDKASPQGMSFSDCEFAWHSFKKVAKLFKYSTYIDKKNKIHITQKPVKLYEWLLNNYAKEGDKILDTHLGSGSIAIASHNLGYDLTACELDKDYFDAALKRINNHKAQLRIL